MKKYFNKNYKKNKYKEIIEQLKDEMESAIEYGKELGVDLEKGTSDYGRYKAYNLVLKIIYELELENN